MIELKDIALSFPDRPLFREVNFTLRQGEIALIRGRSGCGKTSLLRLLSGFLPPDRGSLTLDQRPFKEIRYQVLRSRIIYLHQAPVMEEDLSLLENLLLPFHYGVHGKRNKPEQEEFRRSCTALHLDPSLLDRQAGTLSGGERQRAALIRAHLLKPKFMLLDEPLAHLDEASADAIRAWLAQEALDGTGLVVASHQPVGGPLDGKTRFFEMQAGGLREWRD